MLIIDCILYNGEPIIELRLEYLYNYIDIFLIIESAYTFDGQKKEYFFEKYSSIFDKYRSKIIFIKIPTFPSEYTPDFLECKDFYDESKHLYYFHECYQRNYIKTFLIENIKCDYISIICNCDEIPSEQIFNILKDNYGLFNNPIYLSMNYFYYNFKWKSEEKWIRPFCINNIGINNINISLIRNKIINNDNFKMLNNGGWYLKYFMNFNDIINKIKKYDFYNINKCINEGIIIFNNLKLIENNINSLSELFINYHLKLINQQKYIFINTNKININILNKYINKPNLQFLEINSNYGETSIWLLENILTDSTSLLTCINNFNKNENIYNYFIFNIINFKDKINLIFNDSKNALKQLSLYNFEKYDFIYINDDLNYKSIIFNLILSFDLIKKDGIILLNKIDIDIEPFLLIYKNDIDITYDNNIIIIKVLTK
jgi:beta-1,4-mannosyl-glycoprotein beta-1,4-N-acetylglucosaminyltransferase